MGYIASRCLHVIAERVGHAALGDASATPEQLAHATRCDAGFLVRVLRLLAGEGVFEEVDGRYRHTPASRLLRSDEAHSLRAFIRFTGGSLPWQAYGELGRAVQAGQTPADLVAPGGLWTYLQEHPDVGALFNEAMAGKAHEEIAAVLGAHDFSRFGTVADIGGGHGHLIRAILESTPNPRGVLFDLPEVIADAGRMGGPRLSFMAGSFFEDALPRADAYLLMNIIHDWDDENSRAILAAVRAAAPWSAVGSTAPVRATLSVDSDDPRLKLPARLPTIGPRARD